MSKLTIDPSVDPVPVCLGGDWSVARAAQLHVRLGEALQGSRAWTLEAAQLTSADVATWQVLYQHARHAPDFSIKGPAPALESLSNALQLPGPRLWKPALSPSYP